LQISRGIAIGARLVLQIDPEVAIGARLVLQLSPEVAIGARLVLQINPRVAIEARVELQLNPEVVGGSGRWSDEMVRQGVKCESGWREAAPLATVCNEMSRVNLVPYGGPVEGQLERGGPVQVARHSLGEGRPTRAFAAHELAVLAFYVGGSSVVEQRGRWALRGGDLLLIPAGEPHRLVELTRPEVWTLGFCVPCFATADIAPLLEPFERVRGGASAVVSVPGERHAFLESLFAELQDASRPGAAAAAVQRSLLTLVLNEVARAATWPAPLPAPAAGGVVARSLRFIERHCLGPLTLNEVADAVERSPAYVTTALRRATGRSAVEWIIAGRMAEARRRLLHSDEPVEAIAGSVGYADPTHFIRMFRRAHGATPAAWRAARLDESSRQAAGLERRAREAIAGISASRDFDEALADVAADLRRGR
jgi:AraC family transcriptional regulator, transcriptional activator of pobA